jgi:hypothetical protein
LPETLLAPSGITYRKVVLRKLTLRVATSNEAGIAHFARASHWPVGADRLSTYVASSYREVTSAPVKSANASGIGSNVCVPAFSFKIKNNNRKLSPSDRWTVGLQGDKVFSAVPGLCHTPAAVPAVTSHP